MKVNTEQFSEERMDRKQREKVSRNLFPASQETTTTTKGRIERRIKKELRRGTFLILIFKSSKKLFLSDSTSKALDKPFNGPGT